MESSEFDQSALEELRGFQLRVFDLTIQRLFNSKKYSKEKINHVWQQQRCNCEGTRVILFVFSGLVVICWYDRTNTYFSMELAVVEAQKLKWIKETRLQTPISLSGLSINLQAWNHCPGHEENYMNYIYGAICFFWDIHKIDVSKYRTSHIDGHFFPPKKLTSEVHWRTYWFKSAPACWIDLQFGVETCSW